MHLSVGCLTLYSPVCWKNKLQKVCCVQKTWHKHQKWHNLNMKNLTRGMKECAPEIDHTLLNGKHDMVALLLCPLAMLAQVLCGSQVNES